MDDVTTSLTTPRIEIDAAIVQRNIASMAEYAISRGLKLRPHTKTHKSTLLAKMQLVAGAVGVTVAKAGEAHIMAAVAEDILLAYPTADEPRCRAMAELARDRTVRIALDSATAADRLSAAAAKAGAIVGVLVDLDVGVHRTGVQSPAEALTLAQRIERSPGLRLDGLFIYPGHVAGPPAQQAAALAAVNHLVNETLDRWRTAGLEAAIVSSGSTPSARHSHLVQAATEIRPGTYIFNDMNCVRGGYATLDDCAARIVATVVSDAVPGQVVIDAGSKTLTSDRCGPAPDSGHGHVVEFPAARITRLTEEHGQIDISQCDPRPKVGDRVTVIPNHICVCINMQDLVWWKQDGQSPQPLTVDARGRVF